MSYHVITLDSPRTCRIMPPLVCDDPKCVICDTHPVTDSEYDTDEDMPDLISITSYENMPALVEIDTMDTDMVD